MVSPQWADADHFIRLTPTPVTCDGCLFLQGQLLA